MLLESFVDKGVQAVNEEVYCYTFLVLLLHFLSAIATLS